MVFDPNVFDPNVFDAGGGTNAQAGLASGTGSAHDATIETSNANAGLASGTGVAFDATAQTGTYVAAELASGSGAAGDPHAHVAVNANATILPTFVAMGTRGDSASANITPGIPSGTAAGDVLLLVVETNHATVANPDSSVWTELSVSPWSSTAGTNPTRISAFWRVAISSTPAPTVVFSADHVFGVIAGFRGVDTTNPFNQINTYDAAGNPSSYTAPSITTTVPNVLVVNIATSGRDQTSTALFQTPSNANLADLQVRYHQGLATGDGGCIWIATGEKAAAGSTGTTTGTLAVGGNTQIAITVGLQPPIDTNAHGRAYDATVSVDVDVDVNAELASGTGSAYNASIHVAPPAGISTGTGAALGSVPSVAVNAEGAAGTGVAYDATVSYTATVSVDAGLASGSGTTYGASINIAPRAGLASGTGTAYDATANTAFPAVFHNFGIDAHILSFGQHDRIDFHYGDQPDTAITYGDEVLDVVLARLFDSVAAITDPNTFRLYAYIANYVPTGDVFSLDAYIFAGYPITLDATIHKVQKISVPFGAVIAAVQEWNVVRTPTSGIATYSAISASASAVNAADGIKYGDLTQDAWRKGAAGAIGDWWQVNWAASQTINRVIIFDGSVQSDGTPFTAARFGNTGTVTFSDGSSVPYSGLNDTYVVLDFAPRTVSWLRVTSTTAGGSSCSLTEVEAYNTDQFS